MQNRTVTLIRHGESLGNVDPDFYKHHDAAIILTKKGVEQCLKLQTNFKKEYIGDDPHDMHTAIIASNYQRAFLTAQIVTYGLSYPIIRDARINECPHTLDCVLLESAVAVRQRMLSLIESYPFNIVCFTHGVFMSCLEPELGDVENTEVRVYNREHLIRLCKNTEEL